jgi:secreted PhoX family phosphatase
MTTRRGFIAAAAVTAAFGGYAIRAGAQRAVDETYRNEVYGYGPLREDPHGIFDLPEGFSYRIVSRAGETMDDGLYVPGKTDGMACFPLDGSRVVLVRNHELWPSNIERGPAGPELRMIDKIDRMKAYDLDLEGRPLPGGTTTIVYDLAARRRVSQHLSLTGTVMNCSGGATPWGSWLSCEETVQQAGDGAHKDHGWVFEVPASARGLVEPRPLTGLGRFQHEAAAIDPRTGIVYLTEDSYDHLGLFYRFLPNDRRRLEAGGRLQALGLREAPEGGDVRNFKGQPVTWGAGDRKDVVWIDLEGIDNPHGDLRLRGQKAGAAFVGRGEGVFFGRDAVYFACTSSGPSQNGQILRYVPSPHEGRAGEADEPGQLELFVESADEKVLDYADNLAIAPWGHIFACEDRYSDTDRNHLRALTPEGKVYTVGRNVFEGNAELAGACFSPDGSTCFVNIYSPGITLAITGPWERFRA